MVTLVIIDIKCSQCSKKITVRASSEVKGGIESVMCWNCCNTEIKVTVEPEGKYSVQRRTLNPTSNFSYVTRYAFKAWKETK